MNVLNCGAGQGGYHRMRLQHVVLYNLIALLWLTGPFTAGNDWARKIGAWLEMPATVAQADAIVVLGGAANERLPMAIELFRDGLAPELWYTGAVEDSQAGDGTSAQLAAKHAQEMGVPAEAITLLATTSTGKMGNKSWRQPKPVGSAVSWSSPVGIMAGAPSAPSTIIYRATRSRSITSRSRRVSLDLTIGGFPAAGQRIVTTELYKNLYYWTYYGLLPWALLNRRAIWPHTPPGLSVEIGFDTHRAAPIMQRKPSR